MGTDQPPSFVFHDPGGTRWVHFRRSAQLAGLASALLIATFGLVGVSLPQLPVLGLPALVSFVDSDTGNSSNSRHMPKNVAYRVPKLVKSVRYIRSLSPVIHPKGAAKGGEGKPLVWGFYVNWDLASIVSLRLHLSHLTHLIPEWLVLQNAKGDIDDQTDSSVVTIAKQANLPIYAMLTNFRGDWQGGDLHKILHDPDAQRDLIDNLRSNLAEHNFAGVNLDFEELTARDRDAFVRFIRRLTETLHKSGYIVSEDVPVDDDAYDLKSLVAILDFLVPMVYDEHYETSTPGPVSSQGFFETQLEKLAKVIPPSKLIVGFGNYGYDWTLGGYGGKEVTFGDVMAAATETRKTIQWDSDSSESRTAVFSQRPTA